MRSLAYAALVLPVMLTLTGCTREPASASAATPPPAQQTAPATPHDPAGTAAQPAVQESSGPPLHPFAHKPAQTDGPRSSAATPLPAGLLLESAPSNWSGVVETRSKARAGQHVAMMGVIGGDKDPFAPAGTLRLMDADFPICGNSDPSFVCATPWAYCHQEAAKVAAARAQIRVPGRTESLRGAGGLQPLTRVIVVGTLENSVNGEPVIDAQGIFLVR